MEIAALEGLSDSLNELHERINHLPSAADFAKQTDAINAKVVSLSKTIAQLQKQEAVIADLKEKVAKLLTQSLTFDTTSINYSDVDYILTAIITYGSAQVYQYDCYDSNQGFIKSYRYLTPQILTEGRELSEDELNYFKTLGYVPSV